MSDQIKNLLYNLDCIGLRELNDYKLLNRIDSKYICNLKKLPQIIEDAEKDFKVQTFNDERIFAYESLYFDTPELKTYFDHHQGKRIRYKIRFRRYLDTGDVFLEVKKKQNYTRTNKKRNVFEFSSNLQEQHIEFIRNVIKIPEGGLYPNIWTLFDRITLVGKNHLERITIDTNIRFKHEQNVVNLPDLSIIELKREKTTNYSPFGNILHQNHIKPFGISKYIMGNILLFPEIKHNRFNRKLKTINKLRYGT